MVTIDLLFLVLSVNGVDDLQANLTYLMQRNAEAMRKVAILTMDRNRKAEAYGVCNKDLKNWRSKAVNLTNQLTEVNETMNSKQRNLTEAQTILKKCNQSQIILSNHLGRISLQLRSQRNEFEKVLQSSRRTRNSALESIRECESEKTNANRTANSCIRTLEAARKSMIEINNTCMGEKQFVIDSLRTQINGEFPFILI